MFERVHTCSKMSKRVQTCLEVFANVNSYKECQEILSMPEVFKSAPKCLGIVYACLASVEPCLRVFEDV